MNNNPTHGGKRPGAGRKPTATGSNLPVYCGRLEDAEREAIMKLTPQLRKFALESMVKIANKDPGWNQIRTLMIREWRKINPTPTPTPLESKGIAPSSEVEVENG